ncbi:UDP-N-acetylglucosamine 1-carboxyvinyltransferase, partial [bacterium]
MEKFIVIGGKQLHGKIRVSGAKNATLPILAASLLAGGSSTILETPRLRDVAVMKELLTYLGVKIDCQGPVVRLDGSNVRPMEISEELMRRMRASNLVMGALLGRFGYVRASYPGGCAIGSRPMDLHLKGFIALGAKITEKHGYIVAEAGELKGSEIHLDFPSVGATENLMMAASLAKGQTIIRNAAKEPEIVDLQNYLNGLGANIRGAGTDAIKILGVEELGSTTHSIIPDRIEAGTHMVAAAITGGDVTVSNVIPEHIESVIAKLREAGVTIETGEDWVRVISDGNIKAVDLKTLPYPGFPTDMQAQMMVLM